MDKPNFTDAASKIVKERNNVRYCHVWHVHDAFDFHGRKMWMHKSSKLHLLRSG